MHSNIYSCLFHDANIKEENIIDSKCSLNRGEVTSLQIKNAKHVSCLYDLKMYRKMRLAMNGLENVKYNFQAFTT